nr:hypothetical transcript [Hymenolepis microstoma]
MDTSTIPTTTSGIMKKRIRCEMKLFKKTPPDKFTIEQFAEYNFKYLRATMKGPDGSPYEGKVFSILIKVPSRYPFNPPKVYFMTNIDHPRIINGRVRIDPEDWSSLNSLRHVLCYVHKLLMNPDEDTLRYLDRCILNDHPREYKPRV